MFGKKVQNFKIQLKKMSQFISLIIFICVYMQLANSAYICNNASLEKMDIAMSKALNVGKYHRNFPVTYGEVSTFCE